MREWIKDKLHVNEDTLLEVEWDKDRKLCFIVDGKVLFMSRNYKKVMQVYKLIQEWRASFCFFHMHHDSDISMDERHEPGKFLFG